ncbi:Uracil phosphoribosyltransferase [Mucinivorans hirudinis]|uniref:Uracil phosphoribosyltransferase n=1 Tax=Mucinivorans hirudinis TaxID=1433126 RepID=A0A060R7E9_9BACT|nr:Uracil phosphoribosyltransferase [Mucinivorans hirudinis]
MIKVLDRENSILNRFIAEMRDQTIQRDAMRFRRNLERVGEVMAYEVSKTLSYKPEKVITPLGESEIELPAQQMVVASILRAGIPMHNGVLNIFDRAESGFVSAYRKYSKSGKFTIDVESVTTPSLEGKILILIDPMLATGASIETAYRALCERGGTPLHTHFMAAISATDGVEYVERHLAIEPITIWTAALDSELTVKSYIVPGIGDTGDLAFGEKL